MKLGAVFLLLSSVAYGQAVRATGNVTTAQTNVPYGANAPVMTVPGALITVCAYPDDGGTPCGNTVPVYQDQAKTIPLQQPIKADASGRFGFWTNPGTVSESFQTAQGKYLRTDAVTIGGTGSGGGTVSGGTCPTGKFATAISTQGVPTCVAAVTPNSDGSISAGGGGSSAGAVDIPSGALPTVPTSGHIKITNQGGHPYVEYFDGSTRQLDLTGGTNTPAGAGLLKNLSVNNTAIATGPDVVSALGTTPIFTLNSTQVTAGSNLTIGGASSPNTPLALAGNSAANSIRPADTNIMTATQATGTPSFANTRQALLNQGITAIYVDSMPASQTCAGEDGSTPVNFTAKADIAWYCYAMPVVGAGQNPDIYFGPGNYVQNSRWTSHIPNGHFPNLHGVANATYISPSYGANSSHTASIYRQDTGAPNIQFLFENFIIQANGQATPGIYIAGAQTSEMHNIQVQFVGDGAGVCIQLGDFSHDTQEIFLDRVSCGAPIGTTLARAQLTPNVTSGSITSVTVNVDGVFGFGADGPHLAASVRGCTNPGTTTVVTTAMSDGNHITSVTNSGSSGCVAGRTYMDVMPVVNLGSTDGCAIELYTSDSKAENLYANNYYNAICSHYPNMTLVSPHPTEVVTGILAFGGPLTIIAPEYDTITGNYLNIGPGTTVTQIGGHGVTLAMTGLQGAGSVGVLVNSGSVAKITSNIGMCKDGVPTGYASVYSAVTNTAMYVDGAGAHNVPPNLTYLGNDNSCGEGLGDVFGSQANFAGGTTGTSGGGGSMVYPSAGIANSTGTAWGPSYKNYGSIQEYGDSITQGYGASAFMSKGLGGTSYASLLGSNFSQMLDNGYGGDQAAEMGGKIYRTLNPTRGRNPIVTMLIGTNDAGTYSTNTDKQNIYTRALGAAIAWASVPTIGKVFTANTASCTRSGTWNDDDGKIYSNVSGSSLTCSVTTYNTGLSVVVSAGDGYGGTASITVDGSAPTGDTATLFGSGQNNAAIATNNGSTVAQQLYSYTGIAAGTHTVVIAMTNNNILEPVWMGAPIPPTANDAAPPLVFVAGVPPNQTGNAGQSATYDTLAKNVVSAMATAKYPVYFVDIRNGTNTANSSTFTAINNTTDYAGGTLTNGYNCPSAGAALPVHPGDCGHRHIAEGFEVAIGIKEDGPQLTPIVSGKVLTVNGFNQSPAVAQTLNGQLADSLIAGMSYGYASDTTLHVGAPGGTTTTGNTFINAGTNVLYRCTTAGTLPVGALTTVSGNCGASADTGLRVN